YDEFVFFGEHTTERLVRASRRKGRRQRDLLPGGPPLGNGDRVIVCRLAEEKVAPRLASLILGGNQAIDDTPDLVAVCEDIEEDRILAMIGCYLNEPGMVIIAGFLVDPQVYADAAMRRAVAGGLVEYVYFPWLLSRECKAVVWPVSKRNERMQGWLDILGGLRYDNKHG